MPLLPPPIPGLTEPSLSRPVGVGCCIGYTASFVGSLYLFRATRVDGQTKDKHGHVLTRDHPDVVKARLAGTSISSAFSVLVVLRLVKNTYFTDQVPWTPVWQLTRQLLGFHLPNLAWSGCAYPLLLTATLFAGPLFTGLVLDQAYPSPDDSVPPQSWSDVISGFFSLRGLRNYFVGPLSEEIVFRSCVIATSALTGRESLLQLIFLSPLYFGLAHVHHALEIYHNYGRTRQAAITGALTSTFQFGYTCLFGWYASYLFLKSGSVVPPLLAHVFCNIMGFPQIAIAMHRHPQWKKTIIGTYLAGIAGFIAAFQPLTDVASVFGGSIYWI